MTNSYFSKESQIEVLKKITISLNEKGHLVIGKDEALPLAYPTLFVPVFPSEKIYKKFSHEFSEQGGVFTNHFRVIWGLVRRSNEHLYFQGNRPRTA